MKKVLLWAIIILAIGMGFVWYNFVPLIIKINNIVDIIVFIAITMLWLGAVIELASMPYSKNKRRR